MDATFSVSEILGSSWKYLKEQIWILIGLLIGYFIISGILNIFISPDNIIMSSIGAIMMLMISNIFYLGYYKNMFQTIDNIEPQFSAYGQQAYKVFTSIIASLIIFMLTVIGLILLIVPGIYVSIRLQFFMCFIVEEDAGIMDSIQKSWTLTEDKVMPLFILGLAQIGIAILGLLFLGIGVLVAIPLIYMSQCYVFRKLNNPVALSGEAL